LGESMSKASEFAQRMQDAEDARPEEWVEDCCGQKVIVGVDDDGDLRLQTGRASVAMSYTQALALAAYIQRVWGEA
jgi:hypothetical protein